MPHVKDAVLDGKIVCLNKRGHPQFKDLLFRRGEPCFFAFDLLWNSTDAIRSWTESIGGPIKGPYHERPDFMLSISVQITSASGPKPIISPLIREVPLFAPCYGTKTRVSCSPIFQLAKKTLRHDGTDLGIVNDGGGRAWSFRNLRRKCRRQS